MRDERRSANELIRRRKKEKRIRKAVFLMLVLVITAVILCLKLPYFNIAAVEVSNNKLIPKNDILKYANTHLGENIFCLNKREIENKLLANPYISKVDIRRQFPSTIYLEVGERVPGLFITEDKNFIVLDEEGYVLDRVNKIDPKGLIQLVGLDTKAAALGKKITGDSKKLMQIKALSDLEKRNLTDAKISVIDLTDSSDIKVSFNKVTVKAGSIDDIQNKLNKALNIITQQHLENASGYIDVSFNGVPVISIQR